MDGCRKELEEKTSTKYQVGRPNMIKKFPIKNSGHGNDLRYLLVKNPEHSIKKQHSTSDLILVDYPKLYMGHLIKDPPRAVLKSSFEIVETELKEMVVTAMSLSYSCIHGSKQKDTKAL